jgi:rubredoxin
MTSKWSRSEVQRLDAITMTDTPSTQPYRTWMCQVCGWLYEEAAGLPEAGIAPGTRWEDVPADFTCPECGAPKQDFEVIDI